MIAFTFLNIPVRIQPIFWIFFLFFTDIYRDLSIEGVIVGLVMFVSLLVHEYGHALTAVYFGAPSAVTLEAFGGCASYSPVGMTRTQQFLITLNGPLFQSVLIALSYYLLHSGVFASSPYIQYALYITMRLNIIWVLFNLVPLPPLDGSKIVYFALEKLFGERADKMMPILGSVSTCLLIPYLFFWGYYFFAGLLLILWYNSMQGSHSQRVTDDRPSQFSTYMRGIEAEKGENFEEAKRIFQKLLKSKDSYISNGAKEALAKIYFQQNDRNKAYDLLLSANHDSLQEGKVILCQLAYEKCNYELISKYARDIYALKPTFETALLNSKAFAHLNQPHLAGGWLFTASQFGSDYQSQVQEALSHSAYDSVRENTSFKDTWSPAQA